MRLLIGVIVVLLVAIYALAKSMAFVLEDDDDEE